MVRCGLVISVMISLVFGGILDDPIGKKLDEAKAAYQANLEEGRKAVLAWLEERETKARDEGNKKTVDQVKAERAKYQRDGVAPVGTPAEVAKKLTEARQAMEAAYAAALKDYSRAKQDDLASAVEKQLEEFNKGRPRSEASPDALTPEQLQDKFAGKVKYDPKTGQLELTYRMAERKDLDDFEKPDVEPRIANGMTFISASQTIKHLVQFETVTVTGVIGVRTMKGMVVTTTGGTASGVGGDSNNTMYLTPKGRKIVQLIPPSRFWRGNVRFGLRVLEKSATMQWGTEQLGGEGDEGGAGQIILHGGSAGFGYSDLVVKGKVNKDWLQRFVEGK